MRLNQFRATSGCQADSTAAPLVTAAGSPALPAPLHRAAGRSPAPPSGTWHSRYRSSKNLPPRSVLPNKNLRDGSNGHARTALESDFR